MSDSESAVSAETLMNRLKAEAERHGDGRRIATLSRLIEACDDLLSGEAFRMAKRARKDPEFFNPNFLRLNSNAVHQYIRLRAHIEGGGSTWTGPVATTIRAERDLMEYLEKRQEEAKRLEKPRSRRPRSRRLDEIVNGLQSITDQAALRQALADGRQWKRELDILLATLRRLPSIDIDALREGKVVSPKPTMNGSPILAPEDSSTLRKLLARLRDNPGLAEFGLIFRSGRVKMEFAPGIDLILPEEISLLARLAGLEPIGSPAGPG